MRRRSPEPEGINGLAAVANHWAIERNADQTRGLADDCAQSPAAHFERAVELDVHRLVRTNNLPRIGAPEPVVRLLVLPTVLDRLLEDAVFVAQTVAHGRNLHRGHRIKEASRQSSQATVTQTRVGFLFQQLEPIEVLLLDSLLCDGIEEKVGDVVSQRATDEKLHREIIDALGVRALVGLLGLHPSLRQDIAHGAGNSLKALPWAGGYQFDDVVENEMPFIKRVIRSRERNRPTAVLLKQLRHVIGSH